MSYRWELLLWLWLAFFFNQADRQVFSVVLPSIRSDLGLSYFQLGLVSSVFTAVLAVMVPVAGFLGDICSRKAIVVVSLLAWSLATLCTGFGATLLYLVAVRGTATAAGEAFFAPSAFAMLSAEHRQTRARALSLFQTAVYTGLIASGWMGGAIAGRWGWRAAFWVFGGSGMLLSLISFFRLRDSRSPEPRRRKAVRETLAAILSTPTARFAALGSGAMIFVNVGYLAWMPTYIYERFGVSLAKAGLASMLFHHLFAFLGVTIGGVLSDHWASRRPQVRLEMQGLALLAGSPFLYFLGSARSEGLLYAALAGFGFFRGLFDSNTYPAFYSVIAPRYHASASGLLIAFAFLVASLAPLLLARARMTVGLAGGFSALSLVYLAGAALLMWGAYRHFLADWKVVNGAAV